MNLTPIKRHNYANIKSKRRLNPRYRNYTPWYVVFGVLTFLALYICAGILPYMGGLTVSRATRDSFDFDSFFGDIDSPLPDRVSLLTSARTESNPFDCRDSFDIRLDLISNADNRIDFAKFLMHGGFAADVTVGALLAAADRGVEVNILADGIFFDMGAGLSQILRSHPGINYYQFLPLDPLRPWHLHMVMHDKILVVDDNFVIFGGRNIGNHYAAFEADKQQFYDLEVLIYRPLDAVSDDNGGIIAEVRDYFEAMAHSRMSRLFPTRHTDRLASERARLIAVYQEYMAGNGFEPSDTFYRDITFEAYQITLVHNPFVGAKKEPILAYNMLQLARNSSRVLVQSPDIVLTRQNLNILADVIADTDEFVVISNSLASTGDLWAYGTHDVARRRIAAAGMTLYEFQSSTHSLHTKAITFDDRLTAVGAFNLRERSIRINTDGMLVIDSYELNRRNRENAQWFVDRALRVCGNSGCYLQSRYVTDVTSMSDTPVARPTLPYDYMPQAQAPFAKTVRLRLVGALLYPMRFLV